MPDNILKKAEEYRALMKQTAKLATDLLPPQQVGNWVAERIGQGQDISIADLENWISTLSASEDPVMQGKGESLSAWLEKCRAPCS